MVIANTAFFAGLYAMLALGLHVSWREAGVISLAHAAFFGAGAYAASATLMSFAADQHTVGFLPFVVSLLAAMFVPGIVAALSGLLLLRVRGDYFVMLTLGMAEMARNLLASTEFLGGNLGLRGIPAVAWGDLSLSAGGGATAVCLVLLTFVYLITQRLVSSRVGLAFRLVRDDELLATITGHDAFLMRWRGFLFGAMVAGLAGGLVAPYYGYIDPNFFGINEAIFLLACVALAPVSHPLVTALAAASLLVLTFAVAWLPLGPEVVGAGRQLVIGLALILVTALKPGGFAVGPFLGRT